MARYGLILLFIIPSIPAQACITCNKQIQEGIWNSQFLPNLAILLSAFFVLGGIVFLLARYSSMKHVKLQQASSEELIPSPVPLTTASMVLGIGLGGFIDGIVFHQIFQWHEMLSAKIPTTDYVGKSVNMFWDGIFHAFCLLVVLVGVILFWKLLKRKNISHSGNLLGGGLLLGWGLFNLVEGSIDHHLLKLHNVFEFAQDHSLANNIFLAASIAMLFIGWMLVNKQKR